MELAGITIYRRAGWIGRAGTILLLTSLLLLATGCGWPDVALSLLNVLPAAIMAVLGVAAGFGAKISPELMAKIQAWATELSSDIQNIVKPLIVAYQNAPDSDRDSILGQINTAISAVLARFDDILAALHVFNDAWHNKLLQIIQSVQAVLVSVMNIIPILKGSSSELNARVKAYHESGGQLPNANDFKHAFAAQLRYKTGYEDLDAVCEEEAKKHGF